MSKDDDREKVLRLLPIAAGILNAGSFAKTVCGIEANHWSMIVGGDQFPEYRLTLLERDFRERFQTFSFDRRHLKLPPKEFVELFTNEANYQKLRDAIGLASQATAESQHPLERFCGLYWGLYLCRDPDNATKEAVAIDSFEISVRPTDLKRATIEQLTNPFTTQRTVGWLQVLWDTIEISISQGDVKDPNAFYMASAPRGDLINTILAMGTDIKHGPRLVVARPTLFVRIPKKQSRRISETSPAGSQLHTAIKAVFAKYVVFDTERFELCPKAQLEESDEERLKRAIELHQCENAETVE